MTITGQPKVVEKCVRPCFGGFSGMGNLFFVLLFRFYLNVTDIFRVILDQTQAF